MAIRVRLKDGTVDTYRDFWACDFGHGEHRHWQDCPSLPRDRSSLVMEGGGDRLYVVVDGFQQVHWFAYRAIARESKKGKLIILTSRYEGPPERGVLPANIRVVYAAGTWVTYEDYRDE